MANPDREQHFEAGGQQYTLVFGNRALRIVERELGRPFGQIIMELQAADEGQLDLSKLSISDLTTLLWAGLQLNHPNLNLEAVDDIIDELGFTQAFELMGEAFSLAFPAPEENPQGNGNRAQRRALANGTGASTSVRR